MKTKQTIVLLLGFLLVFSLNSLAETKKLEEIGRYTLVRIKGEVPTSEVMKILVDKYAGDIKYSFDMAGYGDLYLPFMDQLKASAFEEKDLAIGDKMMWMVFRSHGKIKLVEDLEWAGKKPLPVFSFTVKKGYKHFEFIMPRACGNISLRGVKEVIPDAVCDIKVSPVKANINDPISVDMSGSQHAKSMEVAVIGSDGATVATKSLTPDAAAWQTKFDKPGEYVFKAKALNVKGKASTNPCEAKTYINAPPVCKIISSCFPCDNYVGRPITFDASGSSDPDGEVVKVDFELKDETGSVMDTFSDTAKPFTFEKIFDAPGIYSVTAVVTDDFGAMSQPCKIEGLEVTQKRLFGVIEGGPFLARGSHGFFLGARAGLFYWLVPDQLDFILTGGGAAALQGDPWKSIFMANALLNYHSGPAYFGGGVGFTSKVKEDRDADFDILGNIGYEIFNNFDSAGSLFFEVRVPVGEGRSFTDNHKLMLGFRYRF